jgi:hypothetical protein
MGEPAMKWISAKERVPEYIRFRRMLHAPTVIVRFRGDRGWSPDSGRPKGIDTGSFTVHTREWRRSGCNYASKVTHWMPLPDPPRRP